MKKLAIIAAALGVLIALSAFIAGANSLIDIKTFFQLGLWGIALMLFSSVYFLISSFLLSQTLIRQRLFEIE
ncbi:MAG: hypothetical protein JO154_25080 [Chitinophaga sp.]|uniref:hypothetical protein n=1 Tax=Chitinophaga sp. TaxID=1869181 RepID=UPI0025BBD66A|nr:hypothetical protein [Chitinophaga sp.]MBV8255893.1 hypothetical protein [Chitinophaga sp.]